MADQTEREALSNFLFSIFDMGTAPNALGEADAILAFLASLRPAPRTVTTVDELHALPVGAVVQVTGGAVAQRVDKDPEGLDWMFVGYDEYREPAEFDGMLPATVLAPAIDPDDEALVERAARAVAGADYMLPEHASPGTTAWEAAPYLRAEWTMIARAALKAATS